MAVAGPRAVGLHPSSTKAAEGCLQYIWTENDPGEKRLETESALKNDSPIQAMLIWGRTKAMVTAVERGGDTRKTQQRWEEKGPAALDGRLGSGTDGDASRGHSFQGGCRPQ